VGFFYV